MMALGRRNRLLVVLVAVVALAVGVAWRVFRVGDMAYIGSGYAAEQTCACMFIAGRTLESCMTDLDPLAQKLIRVTPGSDEVTASGFGLGSATARYEKGFGCSLRN
ncbi:MAG: hypothetical protein JWN44_6976 [Myxococcales bacterium]|nr:hypothetical protein [Myxococcales bacterium]